MFNKAMVFRFLDFVGSLEVVGKHQLSSAVFPLFVHFYLNVIDKRQNGKNFYCIYNAKSC